MAYLPDKTVAAAAALIARVTTVLTRIRYEEWPDRESGLMDATAVAQIDDLLIACDQVARQLQAPQPEPPRPPALARSARSIVLPERWWSQLATQVACAGDADCPEIIEELNYSANGSGLAVRAELRRVAKSDSAADIGKLVVKLVATTGGTKGGVRWVLAARRNTTVSIDCRKARRRLDITIV